MHRAAGIVSLPGLGSLDWLRHPTPAYSRTIEFETKSHAAYFRCVIPNILHVFSSMKGGQHNVNSKFSRSAFPALSRRVIPVLLMALPASQACGDLKLVSKMTVTGGSKAV